jgi:hypothetical protein
MRKPGVALQLLESPKFAQGHERNHIIMVLMMIQMCSGHCTADLPSLWHTKIIVVINVLREHGYVFRVRILIRLGLRVLTIASWRILFFI